MFCRRWIAAGLVALGAWVVPASGSARGDEDEDHWHPFLRSGQAQPHTEQRSGYPYCTSGMARPAYNDHYSGDYVGGGKSFGGYGRCANEGTWGWDYTPFRPMSPRIFMNWSHGRHYQGGLQGYATDGPKPLEHITEAVHGHFSHE